MKQNIKKKPKIMVKRLAGKEDNKNVKRYYSKKLLLAERKQQRYKELRQSMSSFKRFNKVSMTSNSTETNSVAKIKSINSGSPVKRLKDADSDLMHFPKIKTASLNQKTSELLRPKSKIAKKLSKISRNEGIRNFSRNEGIRNHSRNEKLDQKVIMETPSKLNFERKTPLRGVYSFQTSFRTNY